ncbi:DMT family transporter [Pectobacterium sp. A5351]|uniref:DMT family transporter n=1 Tax=Pectobacterium sp. A5351 TaxID=2914983 RepID=UPI00232D4ACC|nr:DMT family transporter [Pectobacterium sp. A5351]WCG82663.1 DMT family transporter [Pectobacterium sp. A5351]
MKGFRITNTAVLYILTVLTGGTSWYAAKLQLTDVPPIISLIYRFGGAAILLLFIAIIVGNRLRYGWREHVGMGGLGALGLSIAFLLIYKSASLMTTGLIALIYSTVVILNPVNTYLFLKTPIPRITLIAATIGITGIILVFLPELRGHSWHWEGVGYAFGATLAFSLANIIAVKLHARNVAVIPMTGISMAYGASLLVIYALLSHQEFTSDVTPVYLWSLIYLIVFPSVIGYTTYFAVIGRLGPERAAYTMLLVPLVALVISAITENYRPTIWAIVGTSMILAANYWAITARFRIQ